MLTDGCNSRCITCSHWRNPLRYLALERVAAVLEGFAPRGEASTGAAAHSLETVVGQPVEQRIPVRRVLLSGGEPMQHPKWTTIAQMCRDAGAEVCLTTNGLLLPRSLDALTVVDDLRVSLDGATKSTYAAIRGVDGLTLVTRGIQGACQEGLRVTTRTTLQAGNTDELCDLIALCLDMGVHRISFQAVDSEAGEAFGQSGLPAPTLVKTMGEAEIARFEAQIVQAEERFGPEFASGRISESPEQLRQIARYFRAVAGLQPFPPVTCNIPHVSIIVGVDGSLRSCFFLPQWGRLDQHGFATLVNDPAVLALRKAYACGERSECVRCVCGRPKSA